MALPLEKYGLIGDCQTAALVGADGSIDWLCFPWFDSAACFAALLGTPENGRWLLAPAEPITHVHRRYRGDTLILETDFETESGKVTVVDCMPPRSREPDLIRLVIGRAGKVRMRTEIVIRFDYGSIVPWVSATDRGIHAIAGPDALFVESPVKLEGKAYTTTAEFEVSMGDEKPFVLTWYPSHEPPPPRIDPLEAIEFTESWWRDWTSQSTYKGPWRDAVIRSLITLKALTFAPSGGIVAAATTSLPEKIGGIRNWDYRFCWVRDATFTLYSLLNNGYEKEAEEFRDWLLRAVAGHPAKLQIMYDIFGRRRLKEFELDWLSGYEESRPVRVGNAAYQQFQLDVYGEIIDMLHFSRRKGLPKSEPTWRFEMAVLRFLESAWKRKDAGIWEVRGPSRHFTHSKVMAWAAFDRAIRTVDQWGYKGSVEKWRRCAAEIFAEVCRKGFNERLNSFTQYYGSDDLDASLLMLPLVGFLPADDPRIRGTLAAIEKTLIKDGFVQRRTIRDRYAGVPPDEATFLPCSFWYVDNLVLANRKDEAVNMFERLLSIRNDLGLLAEEYDVGRGRLVGNFPQAFSHVGLVNSASNLSPTREAPAEHRAKES